MRIGESWEKVFGIRRFLCLSFEMGFGNDDYLNKSWKKVEVFKVIKLKLCLFAGKGDKKY